MRPVSERRSFALAARDAVRFNRSAVSVRAGLIGAISVAAVLLIGAAAGNPVAGVTMAAGAMLVGVAWRSRGGRPPVALLGIDAVVMALSTFVGCATGSLGWLHVIVLFALCVLAGLFVSFGDRRGVIGTQAVTAVVVFGRFPEPARTSAALAGMVLAGGWAQVLVLTVIGSAGSLRRQRAATAAAYRRLSALAAGSSEQSSVSLADALDQAHGCRSSLVLFRDPAPTTLRSLANEGHKLLIAVSAVHTLLRGPDGDPGDPRPAVAERMLALSAEVLDLAAGAIEGDDAAAAALPQHMADLSRHAEGLTAATGPQPRLLSQRLATLAERLQHASELVDAAAESQTPRERRRHRSAARPARV